jgi:C4-type Zn-finger protein
MQLSICPTASQQLEAVVVQEDIPYITVIQYRVTLLKKT